MGGGIKSLKISQMDNGVGFRVKKSIQKGNKKSRKIKKIPAHNY